MGFVFEISRQVLSEYTETDPGQPWQVSLMLLWAAQAPLLDRLPGALVHLLFGGAWGSGKTETTKNLAEFAGAPFFAGGSQAALIRTFDEAHGKGVPVALDELDSNCRRLPDLDGILRTADSSTARYRLMRKVGDKVEPLDLWVGVPLLANAREDLEPALRSRFYTIELPHGQREGLVERNLYKARLSRLGTRFRAAVIRAAAGWNAGDVERHVLDPEFSRRVAALSAVFPRDKQKAAILLAVADILGLDLSSEIASAVRAREDSDSGAGEEFRDVARAIYLERPQNSGMPFEIPLSAFLDRVNLDRDRRHLRTYSPRDNRIAGELRELGFLPGRSKIKRRTKGGRWFLIYDGPVLKTLNLEDGAQTEVRSERIQSDFDDGPAEPGSWMEPETEIDRAVRRLGPTITYPDGTVTDRRTGAILPRSPEA